METSVDKQVVLYLMKMFVQLDKISWWENMSMKKLYEQFLISVYERCELSRELQYER